MKKLSLHKDRKTLVDETHLAGRELSAQSVMFYTMMAEHIGLGVSDLRAWDLLLSHGPVTAGQFANLTGLTPGAVTGLIDRLERAGAVVREADPSDRRKVIIRTASSLRAGGTSIYFASLMAGIDRLYSRYSVNDLRVIRLHMQAMASLLHAETARLRSVPRTGQTRKRAAGE